MGASETPAEICGGSAHGPSPGIQTRRGGGAAEVRGDKLAELVGVTGWAVEHRLGSRKVLEILGGRWTHVSS
jgi:hypothetical protein